MGLEDTPELFVRTVFGCLQRSHDLCGMMRVIVDDGHAADLSFFLKTAVSAGELGETLFHGFDVNAQKVAEGQGSGGVPYVVDARNLEGKLSHRLAFFHKGEGGVCVVVEGDIGSTVFAVGAASVGDDPAGQALGDFLVVRNIAVDDEDAVLGKLLGEETEGVTDVIDILEEVQMIRVDVQDDADCREKA